MKQTSEVYLYQYSTTKMNQQVSERLKELESYLLLDTLPEKGYDDITALAAMICQTPYSLISLVTSSRQFFKSHHGLNIQETPISQSFCAHAIGSEDPVFIIEDASKDKRFKTNPLVTSAPNIRFYAGVTLFSPSGVGLGTLNVIDTKPRKLSEEQINWLKSLANQVSKLLELRRNKIELIEQENELVLESRRLSNIISATNVGTWEWNVQTGEIVVNDRYLEMVGYQRSDKIVSNIAFWDEIVHPDDAALSNAKLQDCFEKNSDFYDIECRLVHKNGDIVWINDRGSVVSWTDDGEPHIMMGTHAEITERKNKEIQFNTIAHNIPGVVFRYKVESNGKDSLMMVSDGAASLWGISAYDAMQNNQLIWDRYHKADLPAHIESIEFSKKNLSFWKHEWRYHHPDGTIRWHKGQGNPTKLGDGSIIWDSLILDITERKSSDEILVRTEKRFRKLVENSVEAIAILNENGDATYVSRSIANVIGYDEKDAENMNLTNIIHPDDLEMVASTLSKAMANPGIPFRENVARVMHKNGEWRWIEATITNMLHDPDINGIVDNFRDVTERVKSQMKIIESEEAYKSLFDLSPLPKLIVSLNKLKLVDVNESAIRHYGYSRSEFLALDLNDLQPESVVEERSVLINKIKRASGPIEVGVHTHLRKNGTRMQIAISGQKITYHGELCILAVCLDVTHREFMDKLESAEHHLMESSIAQSQQLQESIHRYAIDLEELFPETRISILKVSDQRLWDYASPSLGKDYHEFVDGAEIGPNTGTCGAAAFHKKITITENITSDPAWSNFRSLAKKIGMKTCWSIPIIDSNKNVTATFANYFPVEKTPSKSDLTLFKRSASLLSIIFENDNKGQELIQSNERFEYVIKATNDAIYDWDIAKDTFRWGDSLERLLGHTLKDDNFSLKDWKKLMHPDDDKKIEGEWDAFVADKNSSKWERAYRFKKRDESYAHVEEIGYMIRDNKGNPIRMIGTIRDITKRKLEEQRLRLMESVITNAHDAVLITEAEPFDEPGPRITYVNEAFTRMTGYTSEEVVGKSPRFLQGPKSDMVELKKLGEAIRKKEKFELTTINYKKNGEEFWINLSVSPVIDEAGLYTHSIAIERDVTTKKEAEIQKQLLAEISRYYALETNLSAAQKSVMAHLAKFGEIDYTETWLKSATGNHLNLFNSYTLNEKAENFQALSKEVNQVAFGEGLPGSIWKNEASEFWSDLANNPSFIRRSAAQKSNINYALGIPLVYNSDVIGVMIFASTNNREKLKNYSNLFGQLEGFIGAEIIRKKHEEELDSFFEFAPDILAIAGPNEHFIKVNPAFCKLLGYTAKELTSVPFESFWHPSDKDSTKKEYNETSYGDRRSNNFINRYRTKDGTYKWISWNSSSLIDQDGSFFAYGRDVTELVNLQELLNNASNLARVGGWEIDMISNRQSWSSMTKQIHEVDENYVPTSETSFAFYKEEYREFVNEQFRQAIEQGTEFDYEAPITTANGQERWIRAIGKAEYSGEQCVRIFGSFQDIHKRKSAELRIQSLSNNIPGVIFQYTLFPDGTYNVKNVSDGSKKIYGLLPTEIETTPELLWSAIHEEDVSGLEESIRYSAENLSKFGHIWRIYHADGSTRWLEAHGTPQLLNQGEVRWDTVIFDITESQEVKFILEKASQLARIGSWEINYIKGNVFWSKITREIREAPEDFEPELSTGISYFHEGYDRDTINQCVKECTENGTPWDEELRLYTFKGNLRWVRTIGEAEIKDGKCIRIYGSFQDITDKKVKEQEINESHERFELVTQATNDAIWDYDLQHSTLFWGVGFKTLFGHSVSEINPTIETVISFIHPHNRARIAEKMQQYMTDGKSRNWHEEYQFQKADGTYAHVVDRATFIRNQAGEVVRVLGAMTDITYRKEFEESLKELNEKLIRRARELANSNSDLEQFAFVASHDLQEPLRMVTSFLTQLDKKYADVLDHKAQQYIHFAVDGAQRMRQIILDILDFSRAGRSESELEVIDLNNVVEEVKLLQRKSIEDSNAEVAFSNLPTIQSYRSPILQVFQNLVSNAIKYRRKNVTPKVEISAQEESDHWKFYVKDNGIGIDKEYFEKVFVIFQRLHGKDEFDGTGMGLSIVKKIIENLGGEIWIESEETKGSTFIFTLPKQIPMD